MAKKTRTVKLKSKPNSKASLPLKGRSASRVVKLAKKQAAHPSKNHQSKNKKSLKHKQATLRLTKKTSEKTEKNLKRNRKLNAVSLKTISKKRVSKLKNKKPKVLLAHKASVATATQTAITSKSLKPEAVSKSEIIQAGLLKSGKVAIQVCRELACDSAQIGSGYCRLHYIKNWKKVKNRELILSEGHLNRFIADLVQKFPEKVLDALYKDLSTEADFAKTVIELNLTDPVVPSDDFDSDDDDLLDESIMGSIKKEAFDDLSDY
jgi:hypothetical protein